MEHELYFPSYLQIEVIAGKCSARCVMCDIDHSPRKGLMSIEEYETILNKFVKHTDRLKFLNLQGLGESLLDPTLPEKIAIAKRKGFKGTGFATNATHLSKKKGKELLESGLDTLIVSLDGIKKETHESIRRVNYDKVLKNVLNFIDQRNASGRTKVIVRMIRQDANRGEWDEYREYWLQRLDPQYGDQVAGYDVWGTQVEEKRIERFNRLQEWSQTKKQICSDLLERMLLFINGDVILCCGSQQVMGNVLKEDPEAIFNGPGFSRYRQMMQEGRLTDIECCKNCQVILSSMDKEYIDARGLCA